MKLLVVVLSLAFSSSVFAFPRAPFNALTVENLNKSVLEVDANYDFEGIVKLSNCSGSIVKFENQPMASKAMVLTNGHCLGGSFGGMMKPGEVIVNKKDARSMKVFTKEKKLISIKTTKVIYATMTNTDMTLFEISDS